MRRSASGRRGAPPVHVCFSARPTCSEGFGGLESTGTHEARARKRAMRRNIARRDLRENGAQPQSTKCDAWARLCAGQAEGLPGRMACAYLENSFSRDLDSATWGFDFVT